MIKNNSNTVTFDSSLNFTLIQNIPRKHQKLVFHRNGIAKSLPINFENFLKTEQSCKWFNYDNIVTYH